jgi:hypothetical protein
MPTTTQVNTCRCGHGEADLPLFFIARSHYDLDGNEVGEEDHMFPGCKGCGETFCACGKQHKVARDLPENVVDATGHDTRAEQRGER